MDIMYLIASTDIGGAEKVLLDMCKSVSGEDNSVQVCLFESSNTNQELKQILIEKGIKTHAIKMQFPFYFKEIYKLRKLCIDQKIDILHCHGFRADVIGGLVGKLTRVKLISSVHGWIAFTKKMKFYKFLDVWILRHFDLILPVSKKLKEELISKRICSTKIKVLRNIPCLGEVRKHPRKSDDVVVQLGFVGRLSNEKGVEILLQAFSRLLEEFRLELHIVGDGPLKKSIEEKITELKLSSYVKMHGFVRTPGEIYKKLDMLVMPSLTEGTPLTLLEAMSFGLPVVASAVGGIPEIINDGDNGILVKPGDVEQLIKKIKQLIVDKNIRKEISQSALLTINDICDRNKWKSILLNSYTALA